MPVGDTEKQDRFVTRNLAFYERYPNLLRALNDAFKRTVQSDRIVDPIIFYLGHRTVVDFEAIFILAANDMALPAQSLVRGMYERVVTAGHLAQNPAEAQAFADFDYVQRRRAAMTLKELGDIPIEQQENLDVLEEHYQRVKDQFLVSCECGKSRVGPSWSKLDFASMAKRHDAIRELLVHAYYLPLQQAHSTLKSASALLQMSNNEKTYRTSYEELSDEICRLAHLLLLHALQVQRDHFRLPDLEASLEVAFADHVYICGVSS